MAHFQQSPISRVTVDLQTRGNTGAFSPRGEVSGIWQCVAGLRGFELAYDGINLSSQGAREIAFAAWPALSNGTEDICASRHRSSARQESWTGLHAGTEHSCVYPGLA